MYRSLMLPLALLLVIRMPVLGDVVVLQNGETVEGKVVRQNADAIVIEVNVSSGIVDTRTYQQSEVKEVRKESPDQAAYEAVADARVGPNSMMPSDYDMHVSKLRAFLRAHPTSSFKPAVEENLQALLAEKERVEQGELKQDGKWLDAEEVKKNRYQIEARSVFDQMKQLAREGNYVGALNAFDTLETEYPGSKSFPEAVPIARQLIRTLETDLSRKKIIAEREEAERKKGVEITSEPRKSHLIAAHEAEQEQFKDLLDQAAAQKIKWPPVIPRSPESMEAVEKLIVAEEKRLAGINLKGMEASIEALERAEAAIASHDLDEAKTQLETARKEWSANERIKKVEEELKAKEAEASASPTPAAADGTAPAATTSPAPPAATPGGGPATSGLGTPRPISPTPTNAISNASPSAPIREEEPRPFYNTVGGAVAIVGGVLLVVGAVAVLGKVKKPDEPEEPRV